MKVICYDFFENIVDGEYSVIIKNYFNCTAKAVGAIDKVEHIHNS